MTIEYYEMLEGCLLLVGVEKHLDEERALMAVIQLEDWGYYTEVY